MVATQTGKTESAKERAARLFLLAFQAGQKALSQAHEDRKEQEREAAKMGGVSFGF